MIEFHTVEIDFLVSNQLQLAEWLTFSANTESCKIGAINLIICSDKHLLEMNQQFLNHDYYTDIITFDTSIGSTISGDLYVSIDRVKDNASNFGFNLTNELHRVFVHGLLHLCGYADQTKPEQAMMRAKEDHYLSLRAFV
jgi:rRNA maturation RNase YbeY